MEFVKQPWPAAAWAAFDKNTRCGDKEVSNGAKGIKLGGDWGGRDCQ